MVTKNYARFCTCTKRYPDQSYLSYHLQIKDIDGVMRDETNDNFRLEYGHYIQRFTPMVFNDASLRSSTDDIGLLYRTGMFFGKGTSQATKNDYKLEDPIAFSDNGLSVVSSNIAHMPDENTLYTYVYAVKNNGVEPITISETGLISKTLTDQYKDNTTYTFLWARDTFEPVTLQPGETRPFTMTIGLE